MRLCICVCVCIWVCVATAGFLSFSFQSSVRAVLHTQFLQALLDFGSMQKRKEGEKDPQHTSTTSYTQHKSLESNCFPDQSTSLLVLPQIDIYTCVCMCVRECVRIRSHTHVCLSLLRTLTQMTMLSMRA